MDKKPKKNSGRPVPARDKPSAHPSKPPYAPNMVARGVGAGVCLFLAVLVGLSIFGSSAIVIDFLCNTLKGLVGYGFYLTLPALVIAAALLLIQRQKRVTARLWCLGLLPIFFAALLHMLLSPYQYEIAPAAFLRLWVDGRALFCGGILGGFLSVSFVTWFSKVGAGLIFVLVILFLIAVVFHLTPMSIAARRKRRREQREYDDYDDYDPPQQPFSPAGRTDPPAEKPTTPLVSVQTTTSEPGSGEKPVSNRPQLEVNDTGLIPGLERIPFTSGKRDSAAPSGSSSLGGADKPSRIGKEGLLGKGKSLLFGKKREGGDTEQFTPGEGSTPGREEEPVPPIQEPVRAQKTEMTAVTEEVTPLTAPFEETFPEAEIVEEAETPSESKATKAAEEASEEKSYRPPSLNLLKNSRSSEKKKSDTPSDKELAKNQRILEDTLRSFGVEAEMTGKVCGPSVTRYEIRLKQGIRLNKVTNLADDIALALGVSSVRIAPVPNELSVVGVEIPNKQVSPVAISEVLHSDSFKTHKSSAAFGVGKDIGGQYIIGDCAKLPHLLIAGTTGSGKSVCINSLIVSLLYKSTPDTLRLIMVDPKMVELGIYNSIPQLLIPVVTDPKQAAGALQWAVTEMMKRYRMFAEAGVRELSSYNAWVKEQNGGKEKAKKSQTPDSTGKKPEVLPRVVIVIDELADLMIVAAKEVEEAICRVAQMGRAAGMHLVIATQRPSADVITGLMKANIPSRIAFAVASSLESRIILDTPGAEKLVGKGDMLWFPLGAGKPLRVQGCFISDEEVAAVVEDVKKNGGGSYDDRVLREIEQHVSEADKKGKGAYPAGEAAEEEQDEMFDAAVDVVLELGQASVSMLQRRLKLGYARAARLVDQMEEKGIVGPFEGSKPRQMLITQEQWQEMKEKREGGSPLDSTAEAPPPSP